MVRRHDNTSILATLCVAIARRITNDHDQRLGSLRSTISYLPGLIGHRQLAQALASCGENRVGHCKNDG